MRLYITTILIVTGLLSQGQTTSKIDTLEANKYWRLADSHLELRNYKKAVDLLAKSSKLFQREHFLNRGIDCLKKEAEIYIAINELDEAEKNSSRNLSV